MRTPLSFLVALLAIASPTLAQTFRAASSNSTYIAYRTDGRTGTGTLTDPYNGSTAARLDTLLSNAPAGEAIYFYPSLDYQSKPVLSDGNPSWRPKSGQSYIGIGGMDKVRISMATNTPVPSDGAAVFNADTTSPVTNVLIKDIWIENNHSKFLTAGTISNAASAISIFGSDITVDGVRSTGAWGVNGGKEGFPIFLAIYGFTNQQYFGAMTVRNSEVIHTNAAPWSYVSGITILSAVTTQDSNAAPANFDQVKIGVAENNTVISTTPTMQTAFSMSPQSRYAHNRVYGVRFGYIDTAKIHEIEVVDNYVYGDGQANVLYFSITTNGPLSSAQAGNIRVIGNTFVTRTNNGNGGGANGQLYFQSGITGNASAWGNQTNLATGEVQWIGYTNIYIANNRFLSLDPTTPAFDLGNPAIGGQFDGLQVIGNTFDGMLNALSIAGASSNILFSGNTVRGGDYAIRHFTSADTSQNSRRIKIIGNVFKEQYRGAYYGSAHDLELVGNTFVDYMRGLTNLNTAVPAINIGTNYVTAAQQNPTNVTVANNRFLLTYKDLQYPIVASNVVNLQYYGNIDESTVGPQVFSSTMVGPSFHTSLHITNAGGLAGVYTNGVLLSPVPGGSENTQPGTNLVMAGTTLSLSNTIINDAAKWRSNSSYLGGALGAGQWASWASNGVWHLTAPHGSVLTLNSNGVLLTNGTAIAGGSGAAQTPWAQNIDAASYSLRAAGYVEVFTGGGTGLSVLGLNPASLNLRQSTGISTNIGWYMALGSDGSPEPFNSNTLAIATYSGVGGWPNNVGLYIGTNGSIGPTTVNAQLGSEGNAWKSIHLTNPAAGGPQIYTNGVAVPLHLIGTGGNVSAANDGASGEVAIYGGSAKMIAFTNTISANISLAGVPTNSLLAIGGDGFATNATLNANQFVTNLATATAGPQYSIKTNALISTPVFTNDGVANTVGAIIDVSPGDTNMLFRFGGTNRLVLGRHSGAYGLFPVADGGGNLGRSTTSFRWAEGHFVDAVSLGSSGVFTHGSAQTRVNGAYPYWTDNGLNGTGIEFRYSGATPPSAAHGATNRSRIISTNIGGISYPLIVTGNTNQIAFGGTTNAAAGATDSYIVVWVNGVMHTINSKIAP